MIERERFEAWARQRWTHPEDFDQRIKASSKYNNYEVQAAWEAWQERSAQPSDLAEAIIADMQAQYDSELITENDSGEALIRLDGAIAAVEDNFAAATEAKP